MNANAVFNNCGFTACSWVIYYFCTHLKQIFLATHPHQLPIFYNFETALLIKILKNKSTMEILKGKSQESSVSR